MGSASQTDILQFRSWGFELFVPPTPFGSPDGRNRFAMLDDLNQVFYDVDYETALLGNKTEWKQLALHLIPDPAIVFPPEQQDMLQNMGFATGLLVAIESRTPALITARKLGRVNVKPLPENLMNWHALGSRKGMELPAEMRNGLLRYVWNRRQGAGFQRASYVTPSTILNAMPKQWHRDGIALNWELDERFAGAKCIGPPSRWRVSGLDAEQIQKSRTRGKLFVED